MSKRTLLPPGVATPARRTGSIGAGMPTAEIPADTAGPGFGPLAVVRVGAVAAECREWDPVTACKITTSDKRATPAAASAVGDVKREGLRSGSRLKMSLTCASPSRPHRLQAENPVSMGYADIVGVDPV